MEFFNLINKRYSVRNFLDKEIEDSIIDKILEAANRAPSAGNLQAYEIVVIKDNNQKDKIYKVALEQDSVKKAPVAFIFFANPGRSSVKYRVRGEKLYCLQDATIAAAYAQLACHDLGLGCVWVGAFDEKEVRGVCDAPDDLRPVVILPVGYPKEMPGETFRRRLDDLVRYEKF